MFLQVDLAGVDLLLVGDSVGMVVHGHDTTLPVTVPEMLTLCRAVSRGAQRPFIVGDRIELKTTGGGTVLVGIVEKIDPMRTVLRTDSTVPQAIPNKSASPLFSLNFQLHSSCDRQVLAV